MRKYIKEHQALTFAMGLALMFLFLGNQVSVPSSLQVSVHKISKTYAASQTDTVTFARERGLSGLSFGVHYKDSSNITSVVCRRYVDGLLVPAVAGDTLIATDSSASARSILKTVTLAPIPDTYAFIVVYAANHGAIDQGVTTPTVVYELNTQYSYSSN